MGNIANKGQIPAIQGNKKVMFNSIRRLLKNVRPTKIPIRDKEGKTIKPTEEKIQRWKEYLEWIHNSSTSFLGKEGTARLPPPPTPPVINKH